MLLLFSLVAFLSTSCLGSLQRLQVKHMELKRGVPDGTLFTFYFWHKGNDNKPESVKINFYHLPSIETHGLLDHAHLRIDRDWSEPVISDTFTDKRWGHETVAEQVVDDVPSNGWWRVDFLKLDGYHANVCFQGFWSQIREFSLNLDDVHSIYIVSDFVDFDRTYMTYKLPNDNLAPVSMNKLNDVIANSWNSYADSRYYPTIYQEYPFFPVGTHIEISAWLRASQGARTLHPRLLFVPKGMQTEETIFGVQQHWESPSCVFSTVSGGHRPIECTRGAPNGDLQHLYLERIGSYKIKVTVFYKNGVSGISCLHELVGVDGGMPFFIDHSIPRAIGIKQDK